LFRHRLWQGIEFILGVLLLTLPWIANFARGIHSRNFSVAMGVLVLIVCVLTDFRNVRSRMNATMRSMSEERLAGKRVAVVGLDRALADQAKDALSAAGAEVVFDDASRADLAVVTCDMSDAIGSALPQLVVGRLETLLSAGTQGDHRDFMAAPPLRNDELILRAARLLESRRRQAPPAAPVVLTVDDDATTTAIVRAVVTRNGMTCHTASNGKEALELARMLRPSVIVLDVNMPFVGGFEVLSTLRNDPTTAATPVIMLTSVQQEADVVRGFALGADDYVVKPFNPMELLARIQRLVRPS